MTTLGEFWILCHLNGLFGWEAQILGHTRHAQGLFLALWAGLNLGNAQGIL